MLLVFFLSDYSSNFLLTRLSLYKAVQGSPEQAWELYSTLTRQNRLFSSQDYLAYRLSSQSVDLRSAFIRNPTNLTYLITYSDQIHSSQDWVMTDNYFHQLTLARYLSDQSVQYANSKDTQEAKKGLYFMIYSKKMVDDYLTNNQLGMLLINRYKAYQKGLPLLEESLRMRPRQTETYATLGDLYYRSKEYATSRSYHSLLLRLNPIAYQSCMKMAQSFIEEKRSQEASLYLQHAALFLTDNVHQIYQLASMFIKANDSVRGESMMRDYMRKHPMDGETRYQYGLLLKELHRTDEALVQFSLSIAFQRNHEKSYWERTKLWIEQERWSKASEDLIAAIRLNPTNQSYLDRQNWVKSKLSK